MDKIMYLDESVSINEVVIELCECYRNNMYIGFKGKFFK
jgi:hypothetical protein